MSIKTTRICAGEYEVRRAGDFRTRFVRVTKVCYPKDGTYWIAAPSFDNNTSDPHLTKRAAVETATRMLDDNP